MSLRDGRLTEQEIRDRLQAVNVWVTNARTSLFGTVGIVPVVVLERQFRNIVGIYVSGIGAVARLKIEKREVDQLTYTQKFLIAAPANGQTNLPQSYHVQDPLLTNEGLTGLFGSVDLGGLSVNVTTVFWDWDV